MRLNSLGGGWNHFAYVATALVLGWIGVAGTAQATPIFVPNASFESPPNVNGLGGAGPFSGSDWLLYGASGIIGTTLANPSDGVQATFVGTGSAGTAIYQDLGSLLANTQYTLTVDVVSRNDTSFPGTVGAIQLLNGINNFGTQLAQTTGFSQPAQNAAFITESVQYTTGASVSGDLTIALVMVTGVQILYDNVRLDGVVVGAPEPGSLALLGLGALGVAFFARRRKAM